jgi:S-adenosyl methyltransferase
MAMPADVWPGARRACDPGDSTTASAQRPHEPRGRIRLYRICAPRLSDPIVLSHAKALLKSRPQGACAYIDADLRDPDTILAAAANTLDFGQPVAFMLIAVMHFVGDDAQASGIISRLMDACAPGSFVVISHAASDTDAA